MPTLPDSIQNSNSIVFGSCKIEVSTDSGSNWTVIGAARNVLFQENITQTDIQSDNTEYISSYISDHTVTLSWDQMEINPVNIDKIRGGIDTLSYTTGGVKTTDTDVFTTGDTDFAYGQPIYFVNQYDTTTLPSIIKVQAVDTGNSSDTLDTGDYTTFTDDENKCGIIVFAGGSYNDTESLRITYEFETIASRKISSGGLSTITPRMYRLTNNQIVSGTTYYRYFVAYSASINQGLNMAFKSSYDADPVLTIPMSLTARLDTTRTAGDQLWYMIDQVSGL